MFDQFTPPIKPRIERVASGLQMSAFVFLLISMFPSSTGHAHRASWLNFYGICLQISILLWIVVFALRFVGRKQRHSQKVLTR